MNGSRLADGRDRSWLPRRMSRLMTLLSLAIYSERPRQAGQEHYRETKRSCNGAAVHSEMRDTTRVGAFSDGSNDRYSAALQTSSRSHSLRLSASQPDGSAQAPAQDQDRGDWFVL